MRALNRRIILPWIIVGTLDILSAFIYYFIKSGKTDFPVILRYIASAVAGPEAFNGGSLMLLLGLAIHYAIAFGFTALFYLIYPVIKLNRLPVVVTALVYGTFIWVVMNVIVVPLTRIPHKPFNGLNALINWLILIVLIGLPLSYLAKRYYFRDSK